MKTTICSLMTLPLIAFGCGSNDPASTCGATGSTQTCLCTGGAPGAQVCQSGGAWAACQCAATTDTVSGPDTGIVDTVEVEDPNVIFFTSNSFAPDFASGGDPFAGADEKCRAAATAGGFDQTTVALMMADGVSAESRLGNARGWVTPNGDPVADTIDDLMAHRHLYRPAFNELGAPVTSTFFWSGGGPSHNSCQNWTSTSGSESAGHGTLENLGQFMWGNDLKCDQQLPLLCVGVDHNAVVVPEAPPAGARLAFLSTTETPNDAGISGARLSGSACARASRSAADHDVASGNSTLSIAPSAVRPPRMRTPPSPAVNMKSSPDAKTSTFSAAIPAVKCSASTLPGAASASPIDSDSRPCSPKVRDQGR